MTATRRRGFTLVELLVVIGIIAVLVAILLPALGNMRRQAAQVRCATQLREIGNCFNLYAAEFRGYWPVARVNGIRTLPTNRPYNIDGFDFFGTDQGYWFNFLAKYATKSKMGNVSGTSAFDAKLSRESIFFGCPAWEGYRAGGVVAGDTNVVQPGYGMNPYPSITPTYPPATGTPFPPTLVANRPKEYAVMDTADNPQGNFLKATEWTKPAQRMLAADSKFWIATSNRAPNLASYPPAVVPQPQISNDGAGTGNVFNTTGNQTIVDIYRHGKYPNVEGTNFNPRGGKIAYNILFADGHVDGFTDAREAYRSVRMKFPG